jgi:hypothetical protein
MGLLGEIQDFYPIPAVPLNPVLSVIRTLVIITAIYCIFYVTDGNIMYLTDAYRSLISCVIQHYAPVEGWGGGGGGEKMQNVYYDPGP